MNSFQKLTGDVHMGGNIMSKFQFPHFNSVDTVVFQICKYVGLFTTQQHWSLNQETGSVGQTPHRQLPKTVFFYCSEQLRLTDMQASGAPSQMVRSSTDEF